MSGFIWCVIAGAAMSVQGVMNTRLGEGVGVAESNALVQTTAAALSLVALLFWKTGSLSRLGEVPWPYWLGGVLGLVITLTVMLGIGALGPTLSISVILASQLLVAAAIETLGILGTDRVALEPRRLAALALMLAGIVLLGKK